MRQNSHRRLWSRVLCSLRSLGKRRLLTVGLLGTAGFLGSMTVAGTRGFPVPGVADEFSYLLAGDTFSDGRLTNPTHPLWEHFETRHVIHQPSYQSKYPPGQGLALGVGDLLFGTPAAGLWLTAGTLGATIAWALLMWLPAHWAVLAGTLAVSQLALFEYWAQSYWGGNVAAIGGALAIGALGAIQNPSHSIRTVHGLALGTGLGIMAISRPLEGFVTALGILVLGLLWLKRADPQDQRTLFLRVLPACLATTLIPLAFLGTYHHQVTGSAMTFPYQVHEETYAAAPTFLWQPVEPPPVYRHEAIERFWLTWGTERHQHKQTLQGFVLHLTESVWWFAIFFLGPAVVGIAGFIRYFHRNTAGTALRQRARLPAALAFAVLALTLSTKAAFPHYAAPVTVAFYVVVAAGLAGLHRRAKAYRSVNLAVLITVACLAILTLRSLFSPAMDLHPFAKARTEIHESVVSSPGNHLIIVEYQVDEMVPEWVHNRADIDNARVVWAHSMDPVKDQQLVDYFQDRSVWHLKVGPELHTRLQLHRPPLE